VLCLCFSVVCTLLSVALFVEGVQGLTSGMVGADVGLPEACLSETEVVENAQQRCKTRVQLYFALLLCLSLVECE